MRLFLAIAQLVLLLGVVDHVMYSEAMAVTGKRAFEEGSLDVVTGERDGGLSSESAVDTITQATSLSAATSSESVRPSPASKKSKPSPSAAQVTPFHDERPDNGLSAGEPGTKPGSGPNTPGSSQLPSGPSRENGGDTHDQNEFVTEEQESPKSIRTASSQGHDEEDNRRQIPGNGNFDGENKNEQESRISTRGIDSEGERGGNSAAYSPSHEETSNQLRTKIVDLAVTATRHNIAACAAFESDNKSEFLREKKKAKDKWEEHSENHGDLYQKGGGWYDITQHPKFIEVDAQLSAVNSAYIARRLNELDQQRASDDFKGKEQGAIIESMHHQTPADSQTEVEGGNRKT